jgi:hypothetical protein
LTAEQTNNSHLLYDNSMYYLVDTNHTTRLEEDFLGNIHVRGEVRGWKRRLLRLLDYHFKDTDNRERGNRLYLSVKLLNELRSPKHSVDYLELMKRLTLEETIFWVWQFNSYGKRAIAGIKAMHMSARGESNER